MWRYFLAWFPMVLIAIANGTARDLWYRRYTSELTAHQISTITGVVLFGAYIRFIIRTWRPASPEMALEIGLLWLALTLAFEFGLGRARGIAWSTLLRDYNLFSGRLWILILLVVTFAPTLFYWL